MRRFASTWVGKILGGLLLIGLAGFGISNVLLDLGSNTLATVGGEDISTQQFQRAYRQQLNQMAQQTGQVPTDAQAIQLGIPTAVLSQLAATAAVDQLGQRMGIGVSQTKLGEMVRNDPSFAGVLGTFDRASFTQVLAQNGYTENEYFELQTRAARRQQVALGLFAGTTIPMAAETLLNRYRNDKRTVEYFTLSPDSVPVPDPTDADLTKYLADHQADFRTKETRTVDIVDFTPDVLATEAAYQPSEDEIKAEYERTKASLTKIEKREIQQVVLPDAAAEQAFADAQAKGVPFADALKTAGLQATDLGLLAKADVQDPALADAAFGLTKVGDFTVIAGMGNKRAVSVIQIQPGGQTSYDEAKPDIAKRLAVQKAKNAYVDLQDQVEELRAAFKPLKEIAARFSLPVTTVAVTAGGSELSTVPGLAEGNRAKVATSIFAAQQGKLAPTVAITANDNVWFDLTKVDAARDQTLAEVHDAVAKAWTSAKTDEALQAEVKAITTELDSGKSFQDVAAERSQFATVSDPITRDGNGSNALNQQVANQIFSTGPNSHGSVVDGDGDYLVYHVLDVTPAAGDPDPKIKDFLQTSIRDALYADFVGGLRDEAGIKVNQQALSQVLNLDQAAQ